MFVNDKLPITESEAHQIRCRVPLRGLTRVLSLFGIGPRWEDLGTFYAQEVVIYPKRVLISHAFSEVDPAYLLLDEDCRTSGALAIRGQWLFDPHTFRLPQGLFDSWDPERSFFGGIKVRYVNPTGWILRCEVVDPQFHATELVPSSQFPALGCEAQLLEPTDTLFLVSAK